MFWRLLPRRCVVSKEELLEFRGDLDLIGRSRRRKLRQLPVDGKEPYTKDELKSVRVLRPA